MTLTMPDEKRHEENNGVTSPVLSKRFTWFSENSESDEEDQELPRDERFRVRFSLLHLIILHKELEMLRYVIEKSSKEQEVKKVFEKKVKIEPRKQVVSEDDWIFGATCIHLAAKFMPKGLELLLSKSPDCQKLLNTKSNGMRSLAPLHVSAMNSSALNTR